MLRIRRQLQQFPGARARDRAHVKASRLPGECHHACTSTDFGAPPGAPFLGFTLVVGATLSVMERLFGVSPYSARMPSPSVELNRLYGARYRAKNREALNEKKRLYKADLRARNLAIIREGKSQPCTDCRQTFHFAAMDFDHIGTDKISNVAHMTTASVEALLAEIAKCEVVCANCHRIRTWLRNQQTSGAEAPEV